MSKEAQNNELNTDKALHIGVFMPRFSDEEIEEDYDLQNCPNCGSDAVDYDGTGSVPFLECFQCDHNWIP